MHIKKISVAIIVVGHEHRHPIFPLGYRYVTRASEKLTVLKQGSLYHFRSPSLAWSEYSAFFENSDQFVNKQVTGLMHYRCLLNTISRDFGVMAYWMRFVLLRSQSKALLRTQPYIYVGRRNHTNLGVWEQFVEHHPESEPILRLACLKYDDLTSANPGDSENRLRTLPDYIPRNIFLTNTDFTHWWLDTSISIAIFLDSELEEYPVDRWGGFVLERLFTLGVEDFVRENQIEIKMFQQVYFFPLLDWTKILLSRMKQKTLRLISLP